MVVRDELYVERVDALRESSVPSKTQANNSSVNGEGEQSIGRDVVAKAWRCRGRNADVIPTTRDEERVGVQESTDESTEGLNFKALANGTGPVEVAGYRGSADWKSEGCQQVGGSEQIDL